MKKTSILLAAAALLALGTTSCNKEENNNTNLVASFSATCEGYGDKTALDADGTTMKWVANDSVRITGQGASMGYLYKVIQGGNSTADFAFYRSSVNEPDLVATYKAGYPYEFWSNDLSTITLPATQHYVEGGMDNFPMYAESDTRSLAFKNVCGLVKINLTKPDVNVTSITVTTNTQVRGNFTVSYNDGQPTLTYVGGGATAVTLACSQAQSIASGKDFYLYLPAGDYNTFQITISTDDDRYCTKTANGTISVGRSLMTTITLPATSLNFVPIPTASGNLIDGLFSINSDGDQVKFASGNLQYVDGAWRFASHQYDFLGASNSATAWDLFGWSTDATDYGMSTSTDDDDYIGFFVDWGTAINPGAAATPWRTLSRNEWDYLWFNRTNADNLWGLATIFDNTRPNGRGLLYGLVLLPDDWTCPAACTFIASHDTWEANEYTLAQWAQMEAAGAVFLPTAGSRFGSDVGLYGGYGRYWTSSYYNNSYARYLTFSTAWFCTFTEDPRAIGMSVRLVQDNNN